MARSIYSHINFEVKGDIPEDVLHFLKNRFDSIEITEDDDEELINIRETEWFKSRQSNRNPFAANGLVFFMGD